MDQKLTYDQQLGRGDRDKKNNYFLDNFSSTFGTALKDFISQPVDLETKDHVQKQITTLLAKFVEAKNELEYINFKVEVDKNDLSKLSIIPLNMFTACIMYGYYTPYKITVDQDSIEFENGTRVALFEGRYVLFMPKPLENIKFNPDEKK